MIVLGAHNDVNGSNFGYCVCVGRLNCAHNLSESTAIIIFQLCVIGGMSNFLNETAHCFIR